MIADYFHPLTGWRCWDAWGNGLLCAQAVYDPWPPREAMRARCACIAETDNAVAHMQGGRWQAAPVLKCNCGIYAHKAEDRARSRFREGRDRHWTSGHGDRVWGSVKLWGRVIEHTEGYRAEYAYPSELTANNEAIAGEVARLYGVPCRFDPASIEDDSNAIYFKGQQIATASQSYALNTTYTWWQNTSGTPPPVQWWPTSSQWTAWTQPVAPPTTSSLLPSTGAIAIPSVPIVKALGGSRYQQQAAVRSVQAAHDWRTVLRQGLHALRNNADADAMTITGGPTT